MKEIDYSAIKRELESMHCPDHNIPATITLNDDDIKIESCCDTFKNLLREKAIKLSAESTIDIVTDRINEMIKNINK